MSVIENAKSRLETTRGIKAGKSGIDREYEDEKHKGVIKGFAVMTKGNVKDMRGWEIDETTLEQIVAAGNKSEVGLKSRFGHPNMSSTALGTFIGRAKNFKKDGDIARADLYLSKTAYDTPEGDLASYVLDLAEKDPEAFGTSVVLGKWDLEYRIEKNGVRKKDKTGNELPPMLRVESLLAVDVVDDPAANDGLFSKFFNSSVELSAKATEFLDNLLTTPDALEYVISFLERYRVNRADIDEVQLQGKQSKQEKTKEGNMEFKDLTIEQLKKERPDLVAELQTAAVSATTKEERSRCSAIVRAANKEFAGMGMESIVEDAIENGKTLDASLADMRGKRLADLKQNANKAPGADAEPETGKKSHLEKAREYQKEHKCSLQDALSATAPVREKK